MEVEVFIMSCVVVGFDELEQVEMWKEKSELYNKLGFNHNAMYISPI